MEVHLGAIYEDSWCPFSGVATFKQPFINIPPSLALQIPGVTYLTYLLLWGRGPEGEGGGGDA